MNLDLTSYSPCELCPRRCKALRNVGNLGACGSDDQIRIARAALHYWEEPPISGDVGSGAIFFSGCPLRCVFCQNHEISHEGTGKIVSVPRLARIMLELQEQGAANVNLVTPLHFAPHVFEAIKIARAHGLRIPTVCNTSGYERASVVLAMSEVIDIWLTDFKYATGDVARRLSGAHDYPMVAHNALALMTSEVNRFGGRLMSQDGLMQRGVIVRNLVLPGLVEESFKVLDEIWSLCGDTVDISVMSQYTPNKRCLAKGGPLARTLSPEEYDLVVCHADDLGFSHIWWQDGDTADESFIPPFDDTGVVGPEL